VAGLVGGWLLSCSTVEAAETLYPSKDGTLVDGSEYGPFDGVADAADWYFSDSGYEGAITLNTEAGGLSFEHRLVFEYDLRRVTAAPPVTAMLTFTVRGAPVYPFPDVNVHVHAYPADLLETLGDFHAGPATLQGSVTITPYQPPTRYSLDVSTIVSASLLSGSDRVAFRFQVDPGTPHHANQAFIDALDSDPSTKPFLTINKMSVFGDLDDDGDVDLDDFAIFADCVSGPDVPVQPGCEAADLDSDGDVDLADFALFQRAFASNSG